ncbi:YcaO-like family protein [Pseudoalteromonas sp. PPB1]|uniref:YcaO-like family protein n=1 Tax=Pseudoalteromonas sp. PPB1 TaxID=2756136 RepID=UPI00189104A8|nr:YcaO-like family protein [Pseudoalteromonas sp. PPB1]
MTLNFDLIIGWQPQYKPIILNNSDIVVISTEGEVLFSNQDFPLISCIDGKRTIKSIIDEPTSHEDANHFLRYVGNFLRKGTFLQLVEPDSEYARNINNSLESDGTFNRLISKLPDTHIQITENFLCDKLNRTLSSENVPGYLIEVSGHTVSITPKLCNYGDFTTLRKLLLHNKPVIHYLSKKLPGQDVNPPTNEDTATYLKKNLDSLSMRLNHHIDTEKQTLLCIDIRDINTQEYVVPLRLNSPLSVDHHITLASSAMVTNSDGGSRIQTAKATVERLMPFVGTKVGAITHLEPISQKSDTPIIIYRTAFFKTPTVRASENIDSQSFIQVCLGKGVTHEQSKASALCEAIERKNAQYVGDELTQVAQAHQLDARSYNFSQLLPYSEQQYARFADPADSESQRKQAALSYTGEAVNWTALWSLTCDEKVFVPTVCCFANTPFEEDRFGKWHSNGCAAGNNLEEAILQALFELLERDATAVWWYNRLPRPQFELSGLDPDYLAPLHQTITAEHDYWVLDLTVDTGVPVMAAIGRNKATQGYVFGFGCHLKPEMAAQRALTELCQLIPIRDQNGAPFDFDAITDDSFLQPEANASRASYQLTQSGDLKDDILAIVEQLNRLDMETLALDYSRSPIPLSTAKVFVPGLCHIWPQLGNPRLYETPVKLGWLDKALTEKTINQQGLYI